MANSVIVERISGHRLSLHTDVANAIIDKGVDQGGAGDGFRSTELLMGALGSCTIGTMLTFADAEGIEVGDVRAEMKAIEKLSTDTVVRIRLELTIGGDLTAEERERLTEAAAGCKVHRSLHDGIEVQLKTSS